MSSDDSSSDTASNDVDTKSGMSVESEDCVIATLPQATLDSIWTKVFEYMLSSSDVVASGGDPKAKMVSSQSSTSPHYVQALASGQYVCL